MASPTKSPEPSWLDFLCERIRLVNALYGGPGHDRPPMYEPGVEAFRVFDDVDCMTCLVMEARIGKST